jgi:hypothetical protein
MKLYKLTDQNCQTYNGCQWGAEITHMADGKGPMCSEHWIHAYESPYHAELFNCIHDDIKNPILWRACGEIGISDGLKVGCKQLRTIERVPLPEVTTEQIIKFAIHCAKQQVCNGKAWNKWADNWLSGEDRSQRAAWAAAWAVAWASLAASWASRAASWTAEFKWAAARAAAEAALAAERGAIKIAIERTFLEEA